MLSLLVTEAQAGQIKAGSSEGQTEMLDVNSQDLRLLWDIGGSPGPLEGPLLLDSPWLTWKYQAVITTIRVRCLYI